MAYNNRNWNKPSQGDGGQYNNRYNQDYEWKQNVNDRTNVHQSPYSQSYGNRAGSYSSGYGYTNYTNRSGRDNDYDRQSSNRIYADIGTYGGSSFWSGYGSNYDYDRVSQQESGYDNKSYGWNNEYSQRDYRNKENTSAGYGPDYERNANEGRNYNNGKYSPAGVRNIYGGDTSNYGNANQGGYDHDWWNRTRNKIASWFGDNDAGRGRNNDWQNTGQHRGKGPKNYYRSEDRIREDVCDRLTDDGRLDATDIDVQVQGGDIILAGTVNDRNQKRRAADIAESVSGVRNVENRIRVGSGTSA